MKTPVKFAVASLLVIFGLAAYMAWDTPSLEKSGSPHPNSSSKSRVIEFYCAAGMSKPMNEIIKAYREDYPGRKVEVSYGGSGTLLTKIRAQKSGDLYLAADTSYIQIAQEKDFAEESIPVARLWPVIVVKKGNPKKILTLDDLMREDVRVNLGNPEAASVGKKTKNLMETLDMWEPLKKAVDTRGNFKPTVNEIANDVKIDAADAAIVWNSIASQYPELEPVEIKGAARGTVTICVLKFARLPHETLHFARYICAADRGLKIFRKHGFESVDGDVWADRPNIMYFAGGLNRHATEPIISSFEKREGCTVETAWMGCGLLVSKMKGGETPDVYHTCDTSFHSMVEDRFGQLTNISQTDIIILVPKNNPKNIKSLEDLTKPGMKVGIGDPGKTAMGKLTVDLLKDEGVYEEIKTNIGNPFPEAPMVVGQVTQGALDAGLVYVANAHAQRDKVRMIKIENPLSSATQTYAVSKTSKHKHLMQRLLNRLRSSAGQENFVNAGFEVITSPRPENE